jgi:hypothetical protein
MEQVWLNVPIILAEAGVFNKPGLTPLESAYAAPLWEALAYMDTKAALA